MNDTSGAAVAARKRHRREAPEKNNARVYRRRPRTKNYTQTHILPLQSMRIVVRAIVRLGVVPIVVALLVLVLRPRGLGRSL